MRIPESLKISGLTWKVTIDKFIASEDGNFGQMRPVKQEIALLEASTEERKGETLMHEIIEVLNNDNELKLDHNIIQTLGSQLHQVLKDNKLHFDEPTEP